MAREVRMSHRDDMNSEDMPTVPAEWSDGHVTEDTIYAWLDGQLSAADGVAIDAHVAACADCTELTREARGIKAATSRIVGALDAAPSGIVPAEDLSRAASRIV